MKRLFRLFVKLEGLSFSGMPSKGALAELSVNFNRWANSSQRSNRQHTAARYIRNWLPIE